MTTEVEMLTLILTELRAIKAALQSGGRTSQPPASQPQQNDSGNSGGGQYAKRPDEKFATCNRCQATNVVWRKSNTSGKSFLINADGEFHSKTCTGGR